MVEHQIRFDDGAAYERMMGNWSRLAGDICLDWLGRSALVRKRRFGRARYRLKSRQTADQKCLAKTRGGHRGGHMRLIFGAIVGRALHRVGPNSERFGYLQDTHTLRKLLSHLPSCR